MESLVGYMIDSFQELQPSGTLTRKLFPICPLWIGTEIQIARNSLKRQSRASQSFIARREIIDEYGWRHFGDIYADHEAVGHTGEKPLVAHYNNQYDVIHGAMIQFWRSGDQRWFELAADLARHVIDIDIYHTEEDRLAYNGGLFWHTDHYLDAGTATHRAYSKQSLNVRSASCTAAVLLMSITILPDCWNIIFVPATKPLVKQC